jgi:hypothetical protein
VNVTALNLARLERVLDAAREYTCNVIALQETTHPTGGYRWAKRLAKRNGWLTHWSPTPPDKKNGANGNGGTALLWRPEIGKSDAIDSYSHSDCGRTFAGYELWSVYGYAQKAEPAWVRTLLGRADNTTRGIILIGDWNWKPFHHQAFDVHVEGG